MNAPPPSASDSALTPVVLQPLASYDDSVLVLQALREGMAWLGGMSAFVKPGQRVLLKVNLVAPAAPERAVTTHPEILRAVIRLVKESGGIPLVGDSPGVSDTLTAMRVSGLLAVVRSEGAEALDFQEGESYECLENRVAKRLNLTRHLRACDVLITLPKLKTHVQMAFTGALKNQFGLVPGMAKGQFHFRFQNRQQFSDLLIDINRMSAPSLAIMDAVTGMEGNGPSGGTPRHIGALLIGADLAAVDVAACSLIGLDPEENPLNLAARRGGYGTTRLSQIRLLGGDLERLRVAGYRLVSAPANIMRLVALPRWALRWMRRQIAPRPQILADLCIKCGRCRQGCPVSPPAIDPARAGSACLDDNACIRCYCCHEFCPVKAIHLQESWLYRTFPLLDIAAWLGKQLARVKVWRQR